MGWLTTWVLESPLNQHPPQIDFGVFGKRETGGWAQLAEHDRSALPLLPPQTT